MRKGSYSEELVRLLSQCGVLEASNTNVRSHSFITWGHSVRRRFALRGSSETLPQSRKGLGYHHKIVRNASIVVETGLARIPDSALIVIPDTRTRIPQENNTGLADVIWLTTALVGVRTITHEDAFHQQL